MNMTQVFENRRHETVKTLGFLKYDRFSKILTSNILHRTKTVFETGTSV